MGGDKKFVDKLQSVFDEGNYDPANEPDIAYPYLFSRFKGEEWRTQKLVKELLAKYFTTKPDGIPGNDDTGTMSAWAIFSMMGFYPDCPGVPEYTLTTPTFDKVTVQLDPKYWGKKELVIKKEGQGDYIKEIRLGNKKINKYLISHDDLIKAGEITFIVTEILIRNNYEYETILCAALGAVCYFAFLQAQVRTEQTFEKGWNLRVKIMRNLPIPVINDSKWQNVTVPHDWAI